MWVGGVGEAAPARAGARAPLGEGGEVEGSPRGDAAPPALARPPPPPAPTPPHASLPSTRRPADLINTNVWSHNLLVLIQRRITSSPAAKAGGASPADVAAGLTDPLVDAEAAITAADGPADDINNGAAAGAPPPPAAAAAHGGCGSQAPTVPRCSSDHARLPWLAATAFVVSYSFLLSMSVPYFSTLVGIVASSTYLVCAYT
jgi:hypothetical protein